jgi:hypothetical protein
MRARVQRMGTRIRWKGARVGGMGGRFQGTCARIHGMGVRFHGTDARIHETHARIHGTRASVHVTCTWERPKDAPASEIDQAISYPIQGLAPDDKKIDIGATGIGV